MKVITSVRTAPITPTTIGTTGTGFDSEIPPCGPGGSKFWLLTAKETSTYVFRKSSRKRCPYPPSVVSEGNAAGDSEGGIRDVFVRATELVSGLVRRQFMQIPTLSDSID